MNEQVLHNISGPPIFTERGNHERFHIPTNKPGDSLIRGGLFHTYLPEGKCGTYLVLASEAFTDPRQVTSGQNHLLFAALSRSWFIAEGDYISVGEHLS